MNDGIETVNTRYNLQYREGGSQARMANALDALVAGFYEHDVRLAVFDRDARRKTGLWWLDRHVPIRDIIDQFILNQSLYQNEYLLLPIHERDSAELTGEFLIYRQDDGYGQITFFDFSSQQPLSVPIEDFEQMYPAWRLRYWHPDFLPPETPSFLVDYLTDGPQPTPTTPEPIAAPLDKSTFFDDLLLFIEEQRETQRNDVRARYERSAGGSILDSMDRLQGLRPLGREVDDEGNQRCILELPAAITGDVDLIRSEYGLYVDTEVIVDVDGDIPGFPVEGIVRSIGQETIALWIRWTTSSDHGSAEAAFEATSGERFRIVGLLNPIPFDRQRDAVDEISRDDHKRELILGERPPSFDRDVRIDPRTRHQLNQYQLSALRKGLETDSISLIHGPPGTGKTRTLVALIREAVYAGEKVLACAHSNQAVDNLLVGDSSGDQVDSRSLHAYAQNGEFVLARAGSNSSNEIVNTHYSDVEFWEANVVCATTSAAHRFRPDEFDLVVIDEATQATIPSALIPYSKGNRLILAGDHQQLPPYVSGELDEESRMQVSLFEHLIDRYGDSIRTVLRRQYRMNESIASFPNQAFYGDQLTHGQRNRRWTIRDLEPITAIHVDGIEERTPAGSYFNEDEIDLVETEVESLLNQGILPSQIGVISPYSGQVGKLTARFDQQVLSRGLEISTVDAFQGSERDVIILSFVRSNSRGTIGFLGFPIEGPRRLNVALTRARKRLVLIGNWDTLAAGETTTTVYRDLEHHLRENGWFIDRPSATL